MVRSLIGRKGRKKVVIWVHKREGKMVHSMDIERDERTVAWWVDVSGSDLVEQ